MKTSLNDRIREAADEREINSLLEEGEGYEFACSKTRRKWAKTAQKRREELEGN